MTDATSTFAGNYPGIPECRITCILDEGAPTVSATTYDQVGYSQKTMTWQTELAEGDWVAISNDTANTFANCEGAPLVEKAVNGEALVYGKIISIQKLERFPATSGVADTLTKRLQAGYFRTAVVQFYGFTGIQKATIMCDGSHACVPGVGSTLKFNITSSYANHKLCFDSEASGGTGVVPFHYVPAGTDGDTYSCLVGITGAFTAATGA